MGTSWLGWRVQNHYQCEVPQYIFLTGTFQNGDYSISEVPYKMSDFMVTLYLKDAYLHDLVSQAHRKILRLAIRH